MEVLTGLRRKESGASERTSLVVKKWPLGGREVGSKSDILLPSRSASTDTGWRCIKDAGITLIAADSPVAFLDDAPTAVLLRQILGSVSQFEKAMLVAKLKGARDRKRAATGKCGGRKSYEEHGGPR